MDKDLEEFLIKHETKIYELSMAKYGQRIPDWILDPFKCKSFAEDLKKLLIKL